MLINEQRLPLVKAAGVAEGIKKVGGDRLSHR
jgi:hypothetical protein